MANRIGVEAVAGGVAGLAPLGGAGVLVGDWDEEHARASHLALRGRVVGRDIAGENDHATHTTATLLGGDAPEAEAAGLAPLANAWLYDWTLGLAELREVASALAASSHPFSDQAGWDVASSCPGRPTWWGGLDALEDPAFGRYDGRSADLDRVAWETGALVVWPVGNERLDLGVAWGEPHFHAGSCLALHEDFHVSEATLQLDTIGAYAVAKNALTIGAAHDFPDPPEPERIVALDTSGFGPSDDGRVKPDLVVVAERVLSATSTADDALGEQTGSSSAAAAVTGVVALLAELARRELGRDLDAAETRALLVYAAREAGRDPGPDARTGFGLVDAHAAALLIATEGSAPSDARRIRAGVVGDRETLVVETAEAVDADTALRVVLVWIDPPGAAGPRGLDDESPVVVNDLGLALVSPEGVRHEPWSLDPGSPGAPAKRDAPNRVDTVEVVDVAAADNRSAGRWEVRVEAPALARARPQRFALVASVPLRPAPGPVLGAPRQILLEASGGEVVQQHAVGVRGLGARAPAWTTRSEAAWLEVQPASGSGDADLVLAVDPAVAALPGERFGTIVVESDDPSGARTIGVALRGTCDGACTDRACGLDPICGVSCGRCDGARACVDGACATWGTSCPVAELDGVLGPGLASGTNATALDRFAGSCGGEGGRELGFAWTAPSDGRYVFSTRGSAYDTVLYLRDGDCGGVELGCNDDVGSGGRGSSVETTLAAGQRVVAIVDGFDALASGRFDLGVARAPCADVDLGSRLGQSLVRATTLGGTDSHAASCGGEGSGDVAFGWSAPADGRYAFSLRGAHFDVLFYLLDGACGNEIVCADQASGLRLERMLGAGDALTLVVDGRRGASGPFELDVTSLDVSCAGRCDDFGVDGACSCDDACARFGDCCDDACAACGHCPCAGDCAARACGDDGCGGSCGSCGPGLRCEAGSCVADPCAGTVCAVCERCVDGACEPAGDGAPCEDGDPCTVFDACEGDTCRGEGRDCDDGIACTRDRCEPATGACSSAAANACCEDALACEGDDCAGRAEACLVVGLADGGTADADASDGGVGSASSSSGGGCGCRIAPGSDARVPSAWLFLAALAFLSRACARGCSAARGRSRSAEARSLRRTRPSTGPRSTRA